nr:glycosyltransferase family 2 protein [Paramuribaculum intestinale]
MTDVSVIIVNYNTCRMTAECIDSVRQKTVGISYEIILVDNGSTDGSKEFFEQFEGVKYIYSDENLGFGRANNLGAQYASGEYLFLLNSDTLLINNAIKILYDYIRVHKRAGVVGGNLFDKEGNPNTSYKRHLPGLFESVDNMTFNKLGKIRWGINRFFNHTASPLQVGYIQGADFMINRSLFDSLGGFCDEYFMYYEETDLCCRVAQAGYRCYNVPSANICHFDGASFDNQKSVSRFVMLEKSRQIYLRRNVGKFIRYLCNRIHIIGLQLKIRLVKDVRYRELYQTELQIAKTSCKHRSENH